MRLAFTFLAFTLIAIEGLSDLICSFFLKGRNQEFYLDLSLDFCELLHCI